MKVAKLIEKLKTMPQDAIAVMYDGEWNMYFYLRNAEFEKDAKVYSSLNYHIVAKRDVVVLS